MKKINILLLLLFVIPGLSIAQGVASYTVTRQTGITYTSINTTGTSIPSWRAGLNESDNRSMPVPLTFTFNYLGMPYTTVSVCTNGFIDFSSSTAGGNTPGAYSNDNTTFSQPAPDGTLLAIAPFYEDIMCALGFNLANSIKYQVTGSAGSKVFIVEWNNMTYASATSSHVTFQVKLYEADARIEFIYGSMSATGVSLGYTCGINAPTMSAPPTTAQLLTQQSPNTGTFGATPQNALNTVPQSNSMIVFAGCPIPFAAGDITGSSTICENSTGVTYSVPAIGYATGYNWVLPAGFTIASGANTNAITVNVASGASSGSVTVNGTSSCGNGAASTKSVTVSPRPTITLSGPAAVCQGITSNVYTTQTGMTGYQWSVTGGTITSGGTSSSNTATVTWNTAGSQSISVNYNATNGCNALIPVVYPVTVHPLPVPVITGPASVCAGATGNLYTTDAGATNYVWAVSAGGTITAGGTATSNTMTVKWNTAGAQSVSVAYTNNNGCTASPPVVYPVTVNPLPAPTITGPATACVASTGNVYTTQSGMSGYTWTISTGGSITSGAGSNTITVSWNNTGAQWVKVNYMNANNCTATSPTNFNVTVNVRPVPTISGPASACVGATGNSYTTQAGMTGYTWSVSAGGTITSGSTTNTIAVTWNTTGAQTVSVNYNNSSGCNALTPTTYNVTVNAVPTPTLTGPSAVCAGTTGNVYTTQSGNSNYVWAVSAGGTITAGGTTTSNTATVKWNTAGAQTVSVNYNNAAGCPANAPTVYPVTVNPLPVPTITGPSAMCVGSTGQVYTTESGMTDYTWTVSTGGTITAGGGTESITVTWSQSGSKTVTVSYTNGNGCTALAPTVYNVTVYPLAAPIIDGPVHTCIGTGGYVYSTEGGMTDYLWTITSGGTITNGLGSNAITVTWDSIGAENITVAYINQNGCSTGTPTIKNVTVHPLPVPTISGNSTPCVNSGNYPYTTETGMSGYTWAVSPGGTINSGAGTFKVNISWIGIGPQWVSVNYTNTYTCSAATATIDTVEVFPLPGAVGNITGEQIFCGAAENIPYSVVPVTDATSYAWSLPQGAAIASGAGTPAITVNYAPNASSGAITVFATNSCGAGPQSPPLPVQFTPVPETPVISREGDLLISSVVSYNQWYRNGLAIPGATAQYYPATDTGTYWDQASLNNCASDTSNHIYVDVITGIVDVDPGFNISVFPVPNDGRFTLASNESPEGVVEITIFNMLGIPVYTGYYNPEHGASLLKTIDLAPIAGGIYSMLITTRNKNVVKKIIINR